MCRALRVTCFLEHQVRILHRKIYKPLKKHFFFKFFFLANLQDIFKFQIIKIFGEPHKFLKGGRVVNTSAVCQSVGCSSLTVDSQSSLRVLTCCVNFIHLWQSQLTVG